MRQGHHGSDKVWFHATFIFACFGRVVYFVTFPWMENHPLNSFSSADRTTELLLLEHLPAFLFFTCYFIVLMCWAEMYHGKPVISDAHTTHRKSTPVLLILNAAMYTYFFGALLWNLVCYFQVCVVEVIETLFWSTTLITALIYVALGITFLVYGTLLFRKKQMQAFNIHTRGLTVLQRVVILSLMCTICFLVRSFIILYVAPINNRDVSTTVSWFDFTYYTTLELIPLIIMMLLLGQRNAVHTMETKSPAAYSNLQPSESASNVQFP
ncbi:hypothetical protein Pelo_12429 [Pelomyxa schiedti]|nr:hypothetical protein Pelo_12429 [Pelomyxa schiedti]